MSFAQPYLLISLLGALALLAAYVWQLRRRRRRALRFSDVALVRSVVGRQRRWRRHLPIALVLASLGLLAVAGARPQVRADVPVTSSTVILALDVSGSMCATDVSPNRLAAAQDAVREFIRTQDGEIRIGLVVFSAFAEVAVAPTTDRDELRRAVDGLTTGRGTTIGAAILKSVDAIAELDPDVAPSDSTSVAGPARPGAPAGSGEPSGGAVPTAPEIIVLLTDGANTRGISPQAAAAQAAARGVRVYPIGFGTTTPTRMSCTSQQVGGAIPGQDRGGLGGQGPGFGGGQGFGGAGPRGGGNFLLVDEAALREVASITGGVYFKATDADQLKRVLTDLPKHVTLQQQDVEVSVAFTALAAALLLLGLGLSLRRSTALQ